MCIFKISYVNDILKCEILNFPLTWIILVFINFNCWTELRIDIFIRTFYWNFNNVMTCTNKKNNISSLPVSFLNVWSHYSKWLCGQEVSSRIIRVQFAKRSKRPPPIPAVRPPRETLHKLYVSNLAWKVRSNSLREFISTSCNPVSVRVVFDNPSGNQLDMGLFHLPQRRKRNLQSLC